MCLFVPIRALMFQSMLSGFCCVVTGALCTTFCVWQLLFYGTTVFVSTVTRFCCWVDALFRILELYYLMKIFILDVYPRLSLMAILLNIMQSLWCFRKCFLISINKYLAMFAFTLSWYGKLNHITTVPIPPFTLLLSFKAFSQISLALIMCSKKAIPPFINHAKKLFPMYTGIAAKNNVISHNFLMGNFLERHRCCVVLGNSIETVWKLCLSAKTSTPGN